MSESRETIKQEDGLPLVYVDSFEPRELLDLLEQIQRNEPFVQDFRELESGE
jgi:hypothetical protein